MPDIDFNPLKSLLRDKNSKNRKAIDSEMVMNLFSDTLVNLQDEIKNLSEEELAMLIMSLVNWTKRREYTTTKYQYKIGDIFYADLGMAFKPELAYPHSVLILEIIGHYLLVVPSSSSSDNVKSAYHPIDNISGDKYLRRVYSVDGFERTSALLLSNARTISRGRLISPKGKIGNIMLLDEIKQKVFEFLFPRQNIKIIKLENRIKELEEILNTVEP